MEIKYVIGDATYPEGDGNKIIAHVCNDIGKWGAGFTNAINGRWSEPGRRYFAWHKTHLTEGIRFGLGEVQLVSVATEEPRGRTYVCNMIAQCGTRSARNPIPLNYEALRNCLIEVEKLSVKLMATIHMPRIGCGLAGGSWERVEHLIKVILIDHHHSVTVYDLPDSPRAA